MLKASRLSHLPIAVAQPDHDNTFRNTVSIRADARTSSKSRNLRRLASIN
jgi:hypothetical protein